MEGWTFSGPYSILLEVLSPPTEILKLKTLKCAAQTKEPVDWDGLWSIRWFVVSGP